MSVRDLIEKWERKASELWPHDRDYPVGACSEDPAADDAWRLRNCAAELRAALPEQPQDEKPQPKPQTERQELANKVKYYLNCPGWDFKDAVRLAQKALAQSSATDLDAQHDEGRELLENARSCIYGIFDAVDDGKSPREIQKMAERWMEKYSKHLGTEDQP